MIFFGKVRKGHRLTVSESLSCSQLTSIMGSGAGQKYNWYQKHRLHWTCENAATLWLVRPFFLNHLKPTIPSHGYILNPGWMRCLTFNWEETGAEAGFPAALWHQSWPGSMNVVVRSKFHLDSNTNYPHSHSDVNRPGICKLNFLKLNSAPILFWLTYVGKKENYLFMHGDIDQSWNVPWWTLNLWQKWISHKLFDTTLASSGVFES